MVVLHVHVEGALVGGRHSTQVALEVAQQHLGLALLVQRRQIHVLLHLVLPHLLHPGEGHLEVVEEVVEEGEEEEGLEEGEEEEVEVEVPPHLLHPGEAHLALATAEGRVLLALPQLVRNCILNLNNRKNYISSAI